MFFYSQTYLKNIFHKIYTHKHFYGKYTGTILEILLYKLYFSSLIWLFFKTNLFAMLHSLRLPHLTFCRDQRYWAAHSPSVNIALL